ncbi:MAG: HAD-IA family hydrolase [Pseudomonadota bacterium]
MRDTLNLVIFDVDGTLVDSQAAILWSMRYAFEKAGRSVPPRDDILGIVGLSLPQAMAVLLPVERQTEHQKMVDLYKGAYLARRAAGAGEAVQPLYPGAREAIDHLDGTGYLLSAATGKGRRGLLHFMAAHDFDRQFVAAQSADDAPSKPNPGMVINCLAATGVEPANAVMVGDTEFDMEMGASAGVRCIGVSWGYHPQQRIVRGGAEAIARDFSHLVELIEGLWP